METPGPENQPKLCSNCGGPIFDQFFLCVAERAYHSGCLKCNICQVTLDDEMTCYYKEGRILCKFDYYKRYRTPRCSGCDYGIGAEELVMRLAPAADMVYHLSCFRCCICSEALQTGEQYGLGDNALLFCHRHMHCLPPHHQPALQHPPGQQLIIGGIPVTEKSDVKSEKGSPKGRSRKKRPDISAEGIEKSNQPMLMMDGLQNPMIPLHQLCSNQNRGLAEEHHSAMHGADNSMSSNGSRGRESSSPSSSITPSNYNSNGQQRTKRMRTSFKHQQLRSMKQYFMINHNPDAKDLKQLAQKTGLTKRVLQVWFQNARAKYRRSLLKQAEREQTNVDGLHLDRSEKGLSMSPAADTRL